VAAPRRTAPRAGRLLLAALAGGAAASGSAVAIGWALGLPGEVLRSLAPKSVTAPVAMGIAEQLGGIPALAAVFAVLTGLVGAVSAKYLFDAACASARRCAALRWARPRTASARRARMQVHPDAGAYAALALGLQVRAGRAADAAWRPTLLNTRDRFMQTNLAPEFKGTREGRRPRPSCASACTAASAPPPAPPTSCWATSWTARAAAST
jgi:hypothetical protein